MGPMKKRPIRHKLVLCTILLLILVFSLAATGLAALSLYRKMVADLNWRAKILPVSTELLAEVEGMNSTYKEIQTIRELQKAYSSRGGKSDVFGDTDFTARNQSSDFLTKTARFGLTIEQYTTLLQEKVDPEASSDSASNNELLNEWETISQIRFDLKRLEAVLDNSDWITSDETIMELGEILYSLRIQTSKLPGYQFSDLSKSSQTAQGRYNILRVFVIFSGLTSGVILVLLVWFGYKWIFSPITTLIEGSRKIASGNFNSSK
ncbi:MAG: hypothetical protein ACRC2T_12545, partial [Thermoguttaceae bacterium]